MAILCEGQTVPFCPVWRAGARRLLVSRGVGRRGGIAVVGRDDARLDGALSIYLSILLSIYLSVEISLSLQW